MDSCYTPRDCMRGSDSVDRETLAFETAKLVQEWPGNLDATAHLLRDVKGWGKVQARQAELTLDYSDVWIEATLPTTWRSLYDLCRAAKKERDQTSLTFLLATLTYLHPDERQLHATLLAFATHPPFAQLPPPDSGDLDFSYGDAPTEHTVRSFVSSNTVGFEQSSESAELDREEWTPQRDDTFRSRYASRQQQQVNECVMQLFRLRYQDRVSSSIPFGFDLLKKDTLLGQLNKTLGHCHQNR